MALDRTQVKAGEVGACLAPLPASGDCRYNPPRTIHTSHFLKEASR